MWVVTRESNGDVRLWETTKGRAYLLPQRWKGLFMDGADVGTLKEGELTRDTPQPKAKEPHLHKRAKQKGGGAAETDPRKIRAALSLAQDRAHPAPHLTAPPVASTLNPPPLYPYRPPTAQDRAAREAAAKKKETEARHKQERA